MWELFLALASGHKTMVFIARFLQQDSKCSWFPYLWARPFGVIYISGALLAPSLHSGSIVCACDDWKGGLLCTWVRLLVAFSNFKNSKRARVYLVLLSQCMHERAFQKSTGRTSYSQRNSTWRVVKQLQRRNSERTVPGHVSTEFHSKWPPAHKTGF